LPSGSTADRILKGLIDIAGRQTPSIHLHRQLQNGAGNTRFIVKTMVQQFRNSMAYFLTRWYPVPGVVKTGSIGLFSRDFT
jgi:hypothetical protein